MTRSGRQVSVWVSNEELDGLAERAEREGCTRNEAFRRAVRSYLSPNGSDASTPQGRPEPSS